MSCRFARLIRYGARTDSKRMMPCTARKSGFTLIEAMLLLVVTSIVGVAVGIGLQSISRVPKATDRALAVSAELLSEMENWRAVAFGAAPWPASLPYTKTDTVTLSIGGQSVTYNRTVSIQNWDPNNLASNSSPQTDFARVQLTINSVSLTTFLTKPI